MAIDKLEQELIAEVADFHKFPQKAMSVRRNGESVVMVSTPSVKITPNKTGDGLVIEVKKNAKDETLHLPW